MYSTAFTFLSATFPLNVSFTILTSESIDTTPVFADKNPNIFVFTMSLPNISSAIPVASTVCTSTSVMESIASLFVFTNTAPLSF